MRVIPDLVTTPSRGRARPARPRRLGGADGPLDADRVLAWLGELIERTCPSPPVLVGHVLGGAIAARFAADQGDRLSRLVLVDTLGLGRSRPRRVRAHHGRLPGATDRGLLQRFMRQCSFDLDGLREQMGERWDPFVAVQPRPRPRAEREGRAAA